jgi:hypothetical protein
MWCNVGNAVSVKRGRNVQDKISLLDIAQKKDA